MTSSLETKSLLDAIESYLEHLRVIKGASEHTLRNYQIDLKAFASFLEEEEGKVFSVTKGIEGRLV